MPSEYAGSYLDVYANQTFANVGYTLVMALICAVIMESRFVLGLLFTLFFAGVSGAIGGKGVGDFVSPNPIHAKIEWLSFDDTDLKFSSLVIGVTNLGHQHQPSRNLVHLLDEKGMLEDVTFSDGDAIDPPITMDLIQAPYSGYLYLPNEYAFTSYGQILFYVLATLFSFIVFTGILLLCCHQKPKNAVNPLKDLSDLSSPDD
ncbi:hypothetical protein [Acinetobacter sp. c3-l95]|uniref:hypothetical protein n=1 Tax=Acinetobacter sp. c3-l95 TaxID=3342804 RepID=UPI0035BAF332